MKDKLKQAVQRNGLKISKGGTESIRLDICRGCWEENQGIKQVLI